ncbi:hypothetical protein BC941DRAFT_121165, partial [Chlamydoabsidia padenii]
GLHIPNDIENSDDIVESPILLPDVVFTIGSADIATTQAAAPTSTQTLVSTQSSTPTPASTTATTQAAAPTSSATTTPPPTTTTQTPRNYDEAVLYCCQQEHASQEEKIKSMCIVESLALQPIAITDSQGIEHNALTSPYIINKLVSSHQHIKPIIPKKRLYSDMADKGALCVQCLPEVVSDLKNFINMSPYNTLLSQRNYVEISERVCNLLNSDWEFFPQFRFFSAMVLAGAILINTGNNQAIILNTIEVYGRTKPVDVFCEAFGKIKGSALPTSMPPTAIQTRYPGLWTTTLMTPAPGNLKHWWLISFVSLVLMMILLLF